MHNVYLNNIQKKKKQQKNQKNHNYCTKNPDKDWKYFKNLSQVFLCDSACVLLEISRVSNVYHIKFPIIDHSYHVEFLMLQTMFCCKYSIYWKNCHMKFNVIQIDDFKLARQLKSPWKIRSNEIYMSSQFLFRQKQMSIDWTLYTVRTKSLERYVVIWCISMPRLVPIFRYVLWWRSYLCLKKLSQLQVSWNTWKFLDSSDEKNIEKMEKL